MSAPAECCPVFDPDLWQERWLALDGRRFVQARVRSFLHIPLNFGTVLTRNLERIRAAGAVPPVRLALTDENSIWGADLFLEATREVPGARMASLPGTYLAQAYAGPYRDMSRWIADLRRRLAGKGKPMRRLLFYYATCPVCARQHGRNHVVLFAQV